jgi:hypothetical protein
MPAGGNTLERFFQGNRPPPRPTKFGRRQESVEIDREYASGVDFHKKSVVAAVITLRHIMTRAASGGLIHGIFWRERPG